MLRHYALLVAALFAPLVAMAQVTNGPEDPELVVNRPGNLAFTFNNLIPYASIPPPYVAPDSTQSLIVGYTFFFADDPDTPGVDSSLNHGISYTEDGVTGDLSLVQAMDRANAIRGCNTLENDLRGRIAFVERGDCFFSSKAAYAEEAGAAGVVIFNQVRPDDYAVAMAAGDSTVNGTLFSVGIPVVQITRGEGLPLFERLIDGEAVNVTIRCSPGADTCGLVDRDDLANPAPLPNFDLQATAVTPLTVEAGGSIQFQYTISNNTGAPVSGDLFFTVSPSGLQGVIQSGTVPANTTVGPFTFTQNVPGLAPPGTYIYTLRIGQFPNVTVDQVAFAVTVTPSARLQPGGATAWDVVGAEPWSAAAAAAAATGAVVASPNPFADRATLSFELDAASDVRLAVYDLLGREVAVLLDGTVEAGRHEAVLDGARLPSGPYLYRLRVGAEVQTGRLTLVR